MKKLCSLLILSLSVGMLYGNIGTEGFHAFTNNRYFVETGTFGGYGIDKALAAGFAYVKSIDIDPGHINFCKQRFANIDNVELILGDSSKALWKMINTIDEPITFWLDAHIFPPRKDDGKNTPILEELDQIARHPIKTHTILIDDLHCCGTAAFDHLTLKDIQLKIKMINPNYQFRFVDGGDNNEIPNNVLVAYVP